jgi:2-hydroxy-6-oxonona-2,4-dienedioate hydrolase
MWADLRGVEFSQRWVLAGDVRTRILEAGSSHQDTLLFLHGTGGHAEAYVRNLGPHSKHFATVALDLLGHGFTDLVDRPLEIKDYVHHVLDVMDALQVERAAVSGESLGGWVAARLALDHPDRVSRLVLNTTGGTLADPVVMERIRSLTLRAVEAPTWEFVAERLQWLMADPASVTDDLIATRQAIYSQPGMIESLRGTLALQDMTVRRRNLLSDADLKRIAPPTLVVWTTHDPTASVDEGRRIAGLIPGSEFVLMEKCGHWPQYENADEFNRVHLGFLLGHPADTGP